jgi:predicted porin
MPMLAQTAPIVISSANGDSSLTIYGLLDTGYAHVAHSATFSDMYGSTTDPRPSSLTTKAANGMVNGGISGDRFGFKGGTAIGGDFKAVFNLEAGINIISGQLSNGAGSVADNFKPTASQTVGEYNSDSSLSGQLFGRQANFGVSSPTFGTLALGRNSSFFLDSIGSYDALQGAQLFTPIGYSGSYGGGGQTDNARVDNSFKYRVKLADVVSLGYLHKFGGVSGSDGARGADEFLASYEDSNLGVLFAYQSFTDATSVGAYMTETQAVSGAGTGKYTNTFTNTGQVAVTFTDTKAYMLAARYKIADLFFAAGWQHQEIKDPSNPGSDATLTNIYGYLVGQVITNSLNIGGAEMTKKLDIYWVGANYNITKEFNVAASYYNLKQNDFSNGTSAANPKDASGTGKFGSVLLDYRFNKAFDLYAGLMTTNYSDGLAAGLPLGSNTAYGFGARYAF